MKSQALFLCLAGLLLIADPVRAQDYIYRTIDVSCGAAAASCPAGLVAGGVARQTGPRGVNAQGDIVGTYVDGAGAQHGFLLQDGTFTSFDFPVAGVRATLANGINPQGEIVGQYTLPINPNVPEDSPLYCPNNLNPTTPDPACIKAFHYRQGHYSTVMFPGHPGAIAQRITPDGDIYGCLHDHDLGMSMFGAAWTRSSGAKAAVSVTDTFSLSDNGGELSDPMGVPMSMNNGATPGGAHTIVGFAVDMGGQQHGYVVEEGMIRTYDPTSDTNLTAIWDMNPSQQFVGAYRKAGEPAAKRHGFLQSSNGTPVVTLDVSLTDAAGNTVMAFATNAFGINPDAVIVGQYSLVSGGPTHGFVAFPAAGK
jgi:probable HAF family extracellular repeat protein